MPETQPGCFLYADILRNNNDVYETPIEQRIIEGGIKVYGCVFNNELSLPLIFQHEPFGITF